MNVLLIIVALAMAFANFFHPIFTSGLLHYNYLIWASIALIRSVSYYKPIYFVITKKPVLNVTHESIDDFITGTRYCWKDIKEIYEKDAYLHLILYKPEAYLINIKNPIKRLFAKIFHSSDPDKTPFIVNIDLVDANPDALLELLDDYSIMAESKR
jgi:hypothetical protein